jgi:hypothetical protein
MNIVENQQRAFLAQASDSARRLEDALRNLSPAEQAATLALIAKNSGTPIDIIMVGEPGDWREARELVEGKLRMDARHRWELGSGCHFEILDLPR